MGHCGCVYGVEDIVNLWEKMYYGMLPDISIRIENMLNHLSVSMLHIQGNNLPADVCMG